MQPQERSSLVASLLCSLHHSLPDWDRAQTSRPKGKRQDRGFSLFCFKVHREINTKPMKSVMNSRGVSPRCRLSHSHTQRWGSSFSVFSKSYLQQRQREFFILLSSISWNCFHEFFLFPDHACGQQAVKVRGRAKQRWVWGTTCSRTPRADPERRQHCLHEGKLPQTPSNSALLEVVLLRNS